MILYCPLIFTAKLLILLLFLRLFCPNRTGLTYYTIHALIWSNALYYTAEIFVIIFSCNPRAKAWDPTIHGGHCIDIGANFTFSAVWNTAIDLVMLIVPVKAVWALQLPTAKKVQVSAVFATGLLYVSPHVPFNHAHTDAHIHVVWFCLTYAEVWVFLMANFTGR